MLKLRHALAPALAAGLVLAPFTAAAAHAADPIDAVLFSLENYTDHYQEDLEVLDVLERTADTVTLFDGGDFSAAAWEAALAGAEVLVLSEPDRARYDHLLRPEAVGVIIDWVESGGIVVITALSYQEALIADLTGLELSPGADERDPFPRLGAVPGPDQVRWADDVLGYALDSLTPEQAAAIVTLYGSENVGVVGTIARGAGKVTLLAYDWFPREADIASGAHQEWDEVLAQAVLDWHVESVGDDLSTLADDPAAVAADATSVELAATGADETALLIAAALLLTLGVGVVAVARAVARRA